MICPGEPLASRVPPQCGHHGEMARSHESSLMRKPFAALLGGALASAALVAAPTTTAVAAPAYCAEEPARAATTLKKSAMSPATVVVGTTAVKRSTYTLTVTDECADDVLALVDLYRGRTGWELLTMDTVSRDGATWTLTDTATWDPRLLWNADAGAWTSEISVLGSEYQEWSGTGFRVLRGARLSTNASPEPVRKGKTITVTGQLNRADWESGRYRGYGKQRVELQFRTKTGAYRTIKTVTASSTGKLTTTVTASRDGSFRYVYRGSSTTAAVTSTGDAVDVR